MMGLSASFLHAGFSACANFGQRAWRRSAILGASHLDRAATDLRSGLAEDAGGDEPWVVA